MPLLLGKGGVRIMSGSCQVRCGCFLRVTSREGTALHENHPAPPALQSDLQSSI